MGISTRNSLTIFLSSRVNKNLVGPKMEDGSPPSPPSEDSADMDLPLVNLTMVSMKSGGDEDDAERGIVTIIDEAQLRDIQRARDNHERLQRKRRRYE